jgi:hypothetical protein
LRARRLRLLLGLARAWRRHPEMRFCQLVINVAGRDDPFYVEDDEFAARLTWWKV